MSTQSVILILAMIVPVAFLLIGLLNIDYGRKGGL